MMGEVEMVGHGECRKHTVASITLTVSGSRYDEATQLKTKLELNS